MANKGKISRDRILVELSNKFNIPIDEIDKATESQFRFLAAIIRSGTFKSLRLKHIGIFKANTRAIKEITKNKKLKDERVKKPESKLPKSIELKLEKREKKNGTNIG